MSICYVRIGVGQGIGSLPVLPAGTSLDARYRAGNAQTVLRRSERPTTSAEGMASQYHFKPVVAMIQGMERLTTDDVLRWHCGRISLLRPPVRAECTAPGQEALSLIVPGLRMLPDGILLTRVDVLIIGEDGRPISPPAVFFSDITAPGAPFVSPPTTG